MNGPSSLARRRLAALALGLPLTLPVAAGSSPAQAAAAVAPPSVPANLLVPPGNVPFLVGHAKGTLNYLCDTVAGGFAWTPKGPEARLSDDSGTEIITHMVSPDPGGTPKITWKHDDGSTIWGAVLEKSTDPAFVGASDSPWLLVKVAASSGGGTLEGTTYVQRVHLSAGLAPGQASNSSPIPANANGCAGPSDAGKMSKSPYTADVYFFRAG